MTTCAIMQPTYLPWAGYFALASKSDVFIFLDDVQFERRSWQNRNRILQNGDARLLTIPVKKASQTATLENIEVSRDEKWQIRHLQAIRSAYPSLFDSASEMSLFLDQLASEKTDKLADFTIALITELFRLLEINCKTIRASSLACGGKRSEHLAQLCKSVNADVYLSPEGSRDYLQEDGFESLANIPLRFHSFTPMPYQQRHAATFISHLSIIDVIGNAGLEFARHYLRNGASHAHDH